MKSAIISLKEQMAKIIDLKSRKLQLKLTFWQGKAVDTSSFKKIKKELARIQTAMVSAKILEDR